MITLNLIPETIRAENRLKHVYKLNFRLALILAYFSIFICAILITGTMVLAKIDTEALAQTDFITVNTKAYNFKIRDINNEISAIGEALFTRHHWDLLLTNIYNLVPARVKITNLKLDEPTQLITMTVLAETRDDLLKFKDAINNSGYIAPIDLPMSAILQKTNISFNFSSKLNFAQHEKMKSITND